MKSHHQPAGTNLNWLNPLVAGGKDRNTPHSLMGEPLYKQINKSIWKNTCITKDKTIYKNYLQSFTLPQLTGYVSTELIHTLSQWLFISLTYLIFEAVGRLRQPDSWASQLTCGAASPCCQLFFGTGEKSDRGQLLCRRCQVRCIPLGPGICFLALHLQCPIEGMGGPPFWHDFVPATALRCNSKGPARHTLSAWSQVDSLHQRSCCTSANVARLPVELVLFGAHYQLHLLVAQVIFVNAGTSHGFTARRAADLEEGQNCMALSPRHRAVTAMACIPELSLGVGWALVAAASFCQAIAKTVTTASRIRTYAGRSHLISSQTP